MSIEVIPLIGETIDGDQTLHFRDGTNCVFCGCSVIAMRTYYTTNMPTYFHVRRNPGTVLRTHRGDSAHFAACNRGDLANG